MLGTLDKKIQFFVTQKMGEKRYLTNEGFLVCQEVPIARTGEQLYGPEEIRGEAGREIGVAGDGMVHIEREPEEVFSPQTMASFHGKPVVNEHPDDDVTPENWNSLSIGTVLNPRRGTGDLSDFIVADLMISSKDAIADINAGKREVSCGYDADYKALSRPGYGRQVNIIGNHVALVDAARCGHRCSIGDSKQGGGSVKKSKVFDGWIKKLRDAIKAKDCDSAAKAIDEMEEKVTDDEGESGGIHIHAGGESGNKKWGDEALEAKFKEYDAKHASHDAKLKDHDDQFAKMHDSENKEEKEIEGELEEEAPPGTGDKARKARDSAYLGDSYRDTVAGAEVLAPGIHVPTYDQAAKPADTFRNICGLRRKALTLGLGDARTLGMIEQLRPNKVTDAAVIKDMKCNEVRNLFTSLVAVKRQSNNDLQTTQTRDSQTRTVPMNGSLTLADINKKNAEFYKGV